jgi:hypothetical protein
VSFELATKSLRHLEFKAIVRVFDRDFRLKDSKQWTYKNFIPVTIRQKLYEAQSLNFTSLNSSFRQKNLNKKSRPVETNSHEAIFISSFNLGKLKRLTSETRQKCHLHLGAACGEYQSLKDGVLRDHQPGYWAKHFLWERSDSG